jgi:hypothetical protein
MQIKTKTESKPDFEPSDYYENLLKLKSDNPKTFQTLSRALQASVEIYERRKMRNTKGENEK